MVSRETIVATLEALNAAENDRPNSSIEMVSSRIDKLMAPDVHGWWNGKAVPNREAERAGERSAFERMPDYHRTIEQVIVEGAKACIAWTIRATVNGGGIELPGSSIFEFDEDGRIAQYWGYFGAAGPS